MERYCPKDLSIARIFSMALLMHLDIAFRVFPSRDVWFPMRAEVKILLKLNMLSSPYHLIFSNIFFKKKVSS